MRPSTNALERIETGGHSGSKKVSRERFARRARLQNPENGVESLMKAV